MPYGEKTKELWKDHTYRKHMSEIHKGKPNGAQGKHWKLSESVKAKMRGRVPWNKGKRQAIVPKRHKGADYLKWSKSIKSRDGYKCRIGDKNCFGNVIAHHILPWRDYPELRYAVNNGITLCHKHHPRKHKDELRLTPYFTRIISELK